MIDNGFSPQDALRFIKEYGLSSTFGWVEFETMAEQIIQYLVDEDMTRVKSPADAEKGWERPFLADDIEGMDKEVFPMMCAAGWITALLNGCNYDFVVNEAFIGRIIIKIERMKNGAPY